MDKERSLIDDLIEGINESADLAIDLGFAGTVEHLLKLNEHKIDIAYTILLVNLACIDNDFSPRESYYIKHALREHLDVSYDESVALVKRAKKIIDEKDINLDNFGRYLRKHLTKSKRDELLETMDTLIDEDRLKHPLEKHLRERYRKLLELEDD